MEIEKTWDDNFEIPVRYTLFSDSNNLQKGGRKIWGPPVRRLRSNDYIHCKTLEDMTIVFRTNQRVGKIVLEGLKNCLVVIQDSLAITSSEIAVLDCSSTR